MRDEAQLLKCNAVLGAYCQLYRGQLFEAPNLSFFSFPSTSHALAEGYYWRDCADLHDTPRQSVGVFLSRRPRGRLASASRATAWKTSPRDAASVLHTLTVARSACGSHRASGRGTGADMGTVRCVRSDRVMGGERADDVTQRPRLSE